MRRVIVGFVGVVLLAFLPAVGAVSAAPLDKSDVPAGVVWIAHLDVESLLDTGTGGFLLDHVDGTRLQARMTKFANIFGFHPVIDLKSVTVFGTVHGPAQAVAVVRAKVDQEKLLALLRQNAGHEQLLEGERIVHRWVQRPEDKEDNGVRYGTFFSDEVTVISRSKKALLESAGVLDGEAGSLATNDSGILSESPKGTVFVAGARDIVVPEGGPPQLAMLKSATFVTGESDGVVFGTLAATLREESDGQRVRQMLLGFQALALMRLERGGSGRSIPELKHLLKGFVLSGEGAVVKIDFSAALADVKAIVRQAPAIRANSGAGSK